MSTIQNETEIIDTLTDEIEDEVTEVTDTENTDLEGIISDTNIDHLKERLPEGFKSLVQGYGKYAAEVVVARAFPAIDGLKPAQRRILYTMKKHKVFDLQKSANVCGKVLEYHPHSDASVYETAIRLVESAEYTTFPMLKGKGNFSKVYFSTKDSQPAASRYTEMCLSEQSYVLFGEMEGVEYIPTEDGHTVEPVLLPVSYPSILTTPSQGIAVGVACDIPSYNFNDVCNATIEYIKTGNIAKPLVPDFSCGGEYIRNNESLKKLMKDGKAQLKLRGKWTISGKDIVIKQIPYYADINGILTKARTLKNVVLANDETDLKGMCIRITCANKSVTERVLLELLKDSPLQMNKGIGMAVIIDNKPVFTGVLGIIDEWVKFRREVLKKQYTYDLDCIKRDIEAPKALVCLIDNTELRDAVLEAMKTSAEAAESVLRKGMPDISDEVVDYILGLSLRQFADSTASKRKYKALLDKQTDIEGRLADIDAVIISQLEELNAKYKIPRRTKVVTTDTNFESLEDARKADAKQIANAVWYVIQEGLFIKKQKAVPSEDIKYIKCQNKQTIMFLDDTGRLLRLHIKEIPDTSKDKEGIGHYIPTLLGIRDDFKILDTMLIEDKAIDYLYNDGYIARLDLKEWCTNARITHITEKGLAPARIDKLMGRVDTTKPYIFCYTNKGYIGVFSTDFKNKSRIAATKLGTVESDDFITVAVPVDEDTVNELLEGDTNRFFKKCCKITKVVTVNNNLLMSLIKSVNKEEGCE